MPERAGEHVAASRADRRLAELADQPEQPDEALAGEVLVHERHLGGEAAEVRPGGERALVRGGEHHTAHARRRRGRARSASSRPSSSSAESALRVSGSFERDRRHAAPVQRIEDLVGGHAGILTASRTSWKYTALLFTFQRASFMFTPTPPSVPACRRRSANVQRRPPEMAATAESVLKPDFNASRKHFIFTDEHEQLRESITQLRDQGARAARRGVGGDDVPRLGLPRAWASSASSASTSPSSTAARAATTSRRSCSAEEIVARATAAAWRWASRCRPTWRCRRSSRSAPRSRSSEWVVPAIQGQKILCLGITEPDAGSDVAGHQDARPCKRRRRLRHQRLQDLHHQRPPRRRDRARHQDRPRRRLRRLHAVPRADGLAGRDPREEAPEARHARLRHGAARLPGRARARDGGARARSARASTTSCGSSRASA